MKKNFYARPRKYISLLFAIAVLLILFTSRASVAPQTIQRHKEFIPLGVYWHEGATFKEYPSSQRWEKIDKALDDLALHNVNAIWSTHLFADEAAELARRAAKRNIYLVASLKELEGTNAEIRRGDHSKIIAKTLKAWGDAPSPIAWGLGDEPLTEYMKEIALYIQAWRRQVPKEPLTTVVMPSDVFSAGEAGFDILCSDAYPFFGNGYSYGDGVSPWGGWLMISRNLVNQRSRPWMMAQAFQGVEGPYEFDSQGNLVYLPGSVAFWKMPTPAQIKWQAWSALATGAKGLFYFNYRWPIQSNPQAAMSANQDFRFSQETNSSSPLGLIYLDGRPTPQYDVMGETFAKIHSLSSILAPLKPTDATEAWVTEPADNGSIARVLVNNQTNKRYLIVVASYQNNQNQTIKITLGPHITSLKTLRDEKKLKLKVVAPFRQATVTLPPGEAEVFECEVDLDNLPLVYSDDFTTDKFIKDSVNGTNNGVERFVSKYGNWLAAKDGEQKTTESFLNYDIDSLVGRLPLGGIRTLVYTGYINPPEKHGVFWSASEAEEFKPLSTNEFNQGIIFTTRYLKVKLSQVAWGKHNRQGYLMGITFSQWNRAAKDQ